MSDDTPFEYYKTDNVDEAIKDYLEFHGKTAKLVIARVGAPLAGDQSLVRRTRHINKDYIGVTDQVDARSWKGS